jgi:hypothetical protein
VVWKGYHLELISGTSSFYDAGGGSDYKPWVLQRALRDDVLREVPTTEDLITMTAGNMFEDEIRQRYATFLGNGISIVPSVGLRLAEHPWLRSWISHSCDGIVASTGDLIEFKVKRWIPNFKGTVQDDYMCQCQLGMLVYRLRRCRLLYVKRPSDNATTLQPNAYAHEHIFDFDPQFVTTLLRRSAFGVICYLTGLVPTPEQFDAYGKLPKITVTCNYVSI